MIFFDMDLNILTLKNDNSKDTKKKNVHLSNFKMWLMREFEM